jgi:hypothetical protein
MAEPTVTFVIRGADGKKVREETLAENFAPVLAAGETAELAEEKPKAAAKAKASAGE